MTRNDHLDYYPIEVVGDILWIFEGANLIIKRNSEV
jgi:hypothetical protein